MKAALGNLGGLQAFQGLNFSMELTMNINRESYCSPDSPYRTGCARGKGVPSRL